MEIVLLIIGIIIGTVVGYLAADRKSAALRAEISGTKKEIELLKLQKEEAEALAGSKSNGLQPGRRLSLWLIIVTTVWKRF